MLGAADRLARAARRCSAASRPPSALAVIVVVSAVAGFTKAETERIWLPYVPLACAAAAAHADPPPAAVAGRERGPGSAPELALAERERVRAGAGVEKDDLHSAAVDAVLMPDELIEAWSFEWSATLIVDVEPVVTPGGLPVDEHAVAYVSAGGSGRHHEVKIACVEAVADLPVGLVEHDGILGCRPCSAERPSVEAEARRCGVIGRCEPLGAL